MGHAVHAKSVLVGAETEGKVHEFLRSKGNALQKNPSGFDDDINDLKSFVEGFKSSGVFQSAGDADKLIRAGSSDLAQNSVRGIINTGDAGAYHAKKALNSGAY